MRELFIKDPRQDTYSPIPKWASLMIKVGELASEMAVSNDQKSVLAFSLPTRCYASLFFLLGFESWYFHNSLKNKENANAYFQKIAISEYDEALLVLENKRWKRCWFKGVEEIGGSNYIKVEIPCAKTYIDFVSEYAVFKLRKAIDPDRNVTQNQIGFHMSGLNTLINFYNKKEHEIVQFLNENKSTPSFITFTNKNATKSEIKTALLCCKNKDKFDQISFQHILRYKNFMSEFDLSRGIIANEIFSKNDHCSDIPFNAVIFDGSLSYMNHYDKLEARTEVIFLDRTDPQFSNARDNLMARYFDRDKDIYLLPYSLPQIEFIGFTE